MHITMPWLKEHSNYLNSFGQRLKLSMISEAGGEKIFPFWPWPNIYVINRKPFSIPDTDTQTGTGPYRESFFSSIS